MDQGHPPTLVGSQQWPLLATPGVMELSWRDLTGLGPLIATRMKQEHRGHERPGDGPSEKWQPLENSP